MSREARVGFFVFIGLIVLFLLSTQVGSFKNLSKKGYEISTYLQSANGLEKNAKVKANGLDVGYIKNLYIRGNKVVAILFIDENIKIPQDSTIISEQDSMLGGKFLNIKLGKSSKYIPPNGVIKAQKELASFNEASDSIKKAADEFKAFIADIRGVLDEKAKQSLRDTLTNLESTLKNFNKMSLSIKATSDKFGKTADIINERLPAIAKNLDKLIKDLKDKAPILMAKFEAIENQINAILKENRPTIKTALNNIDGFFGKGQDAVKKIDKLLDSVNKVKLEMGMRGEYQASDGYNKGYMDLNYIPGPFQQYKFSIVSMDDYSRLNPQRKPILPRKHEDSKLLFSAQLSKRYDNVEVRTGLIESSVGFGADYYMLDDNLKLSAEVFDFNARNDVRGTNAHAKVSTRFTLLKHVDFYAGYDNFLNQKADNAFIGVGFHFIDDDLKRLITSQSVGSLLN